MDLVFDEIWRALSYLLIAGIVYYAWKLAYENAGSNYKETLWKGLLWCGGIALFASVSLGSPSCLSGSDPVYGGCEEYADDGFEPTNEQRAAHFAYYLTLLYVPVVTGALMGKNKSDQ